MLNRLRELLRADEVDPESRSRALLIAGLVAFVVFALGLVMVGYYVDRIAPRGDTVFSVGDRKFTYAYLEDRVDAAFAEGSFLTSDVQLGIAQVVSDIQNEELVRLIAADDGLSVTPEELDAAMRDDVGVPAEAESVVFARGLRSHLLILGLSLNRYEELIEAQVLEQKIKDGIQAELPVEMEQVDLSIILVGTDAEAATALTRIQDDQEAFADVAQDVSLLSSAADGGALGWTPASLLIPELAEVAFGLEAGALSEVIETERGFYIVRVNDQELRELDEDQQFDLVLTAFGDRLEAESEKHELLNLVTVGQAQQIADHLQSSGG